MKPEKDDMKNFMLKWVIFTTLIQIGLLVTYVLLT